MKIGAQCECGLIFDRLSVILGSLNPNLVMLEELTKIICGKRFCLITSHGYVFPEPVGTQKRENIVLPK